MDRLFADIDQFEDRIAIIDGAGNEFSYRTFLELADEQVAHIASGRQLLAIEASNQLLPLATYVGALRAGLGVLVAAPDALALGSRIRTAFQPTHIFACNSGKWQFEQSVTGVAHRLHPDLAVLLSTSGSTGSPKLVRLSYGNVHSNAAAIVEYLGISRHDRACITLPWSYSYGLSVINSHLLAGAAILLTEHSVTEPDFWDFFASHQATSFAGVPYIYEMLERSDFLAREYPSLRYFTQAGGRLEPEVVTRFAEYAQRYGKEFFVMYGQTEATARMAYMPPDLVHRFPHCIGRPIPGGRFQLIDPSGEEIHEADRKGELVYHGPNVMMGYSTSIEDLERGQEVAGLHTGDIAMRNEADLYQIVGRASRFSKLYGLRIGLDDVEKLLAQADVTATVAGDDTGLVVAVGETTETLPVHKLVVAHLGLPATAVHVVAVEQIPHLDSGKIDYQGILHLGRTPARSLTAPTEQNPLRTEMANALGVPTIENEDSFMTLGGNSLSYVHVSLLIEDRLGYCPQGWESMPLTDLEAIQPTRTRWFQWLDTDIFLRAMAIILVVVHHVTALPIYGAAISLIIVAGYNFARFQVPKLIAGEFLNVLGPPLKSILPLYYGVLSLYFISIGTVFLPQYLLISNFTPGFYLGEERVLTTWWFLEAYLWCIFLFSLLFQIRPLRKMVVSHPWPFSLLLFSGTFAIHQVGEFVPNWPIFYDVSPFMLAYLFAIGWCVFAAKSIRQRCVTTILALIALDLFPLADVAISKQMYIAAVTMLIWIPAVPLHRWLGKGLTIIASASLHIYIVHGLIIHPVRGLLDVEDVPPSFWLAVILACIMAGISVRWLFDRLGSKAFWSAIRDRP
jgi:hypothetical protein